MSRRGSPLNITVSTGLPDGLAEMDFFREPETEKLVFTSERASPALREVAGRFARVEVFALDASGCVDLTEVLRGLPRLGVRNLLPEGGGELNFSMLQADLIDEIYLTLCPFAFGGRTAPTPFDCNGLAKERVRKLALRESRVGPKGELFLRYEVLREAPPWTRASSFARDTRSPEKAGRDDVDILGSIRPYPGPLLSGEGRGERAPTSPVGEVHGRGRGGPGIHPE